jgi:hypothetical protein
MRTPIRINVARFLENNPDDPDLDPFRLIYFSLPPEEQQQVESICNRFSERLHGLGPKSAIELYWAMAQFLSKPYNYRW